MVNSNQEIYLLCIEQCFLRTNFISTFIRTTRTYEQRNVNFVLCQSNNNNEILSIHHLKFNSMKFTLALLLLKNRSNVFSCHPAGLNKTVVSILNKEIKGSFFQFTLKIYENILSLYVGSNKTLHACVCVYTLFCILSIIYFCNPFVNLISNSHMYVVKKFN